MTKTFTLAIALFFSVQVYSQGGTSNTQFNGGTVTTSFGDHSAAEDIIVQPDGKVVAAGYAIISGVSNFALVRYNTNGSLDASFGATGKVVTALTVNGSWSKAMTIQADGKIILAGSASVGLQVNFALVRYNINGSLDASFGTNGIVITPVGNYYNYIYDIALQPNGKIVVAGEIFNGLDYDFAVGRYNADGSLDAGFSGGIVISAAAGNDYVKSVKLQPDGKILLAGTSNSSFALARYTVTGLPDVSFGASGKVTTVVGTVAGNDNGSAVTLQADGKILVAGQAFDPPYASDVALVRYTTTGEIDLEFGEHGIVRTDVAGNFDHATSVSIQNDGKIIIGGGTVEMGVSKMLLIRYLVNGSIDVSFGTNGTTITALAAEAYAYAMNFPGTKIYLAGVIHNNPDEFAIASFINNATPLPLRLTDFFAQKEGNYVALQWKTESEVNTKSFIVERSPDGRIFNLLQEVAAAGNSSSIIKYTAIDKQPFFNINYYRLKSVDIDGSFTYSKIVAVKNNVKSIEVFPNPVQSTAQLQLPSGIYGPIKIDVIDVSGKLVQTINLQSQGSAVSFPINMSPLIKGTYFIKISGEKINFSQKFMKE